MSEEEIYTWTTDKARQVGVASALVSFFSIAHWIYLSGYTQRIVTAESVLFFHFFRQYVHHCLFYYLKVHGRLRRG